MGFNEATLFVKVSVILLPIAFLLDLIGIATSYWVSWPAYGYNYHSGLWDFYNEPSWLEATQAFEVLGFIAGLAALVLIILYIFVPATSGKRIVFILTLVMCFAAAGCIILGIVIYGSKSSHLSWSFALCTIAGIIFGVAGVLLLLDFCKR